ncbi:ERAP1-like C-terminal domain-containing protein [Pyxidicoccus sp. 3LFB2]
MARTRRSSPEARALADKWLTDKRAVAPEMVDPVLAIAAAHGDAAFQQKLITAVRAEKERKTRQQLLGALGSFSDPELAKQSMALVFDKSQDPRETVFLVFAASQNVKTQGVAFDFLKANYDKLVGDSPDALLPAEVAGRMAFVGGGFCGADRRQQLADFFTERQRAWPPAARGMLARRCWSRWTSAPR